MAFKIMEEDRSTEDIFFKLRIDAEDDLCLLASNTPYGEFCTILRIDGLSGELRRAHPDCRLTGISYGNDAKINLAHGG